MGDKIYKEISNNDKPKRADDYRILSYFEDIIANEEKNQLLKQEEIPLLDSYLDKDAIKNLVVGFLQYVQKILEKYQNWSHTFFIKDKWRIINNYLSLQEIPKILVLDDLKYLLIKDELRKLLERIFRFLFVWCVNWLVKDATSSNILLSHEDIKNKLLYIMRTKYYVYADRYLKRAVKLLIENIDIATTTVFYILLVFYPKVVLPTDA